MNSNKVTWRVFASGYCTAHDKAVDPVHGKGKAVFFATWLLFNHPVHGKYLFDTGYTSRFFTATRSFPDRFYRWVTPVFLQPEETALAQLQKTGDAEHIKGIVLSHLHADHVAGLMDFPDIPIYCSDLALEEFRSLSGFSAVKKGMLKKLFPKDFEQRVRPFTFRKNSVVKNGFQWINFFEGDQTVQLALLPGHARGQIGIRLSGVQETLFFAADAGWRKATLRAGILPRKIIRIFIDSWEDYVATFRALEQYESNCPDETLLFTHCPETMEYLATANHV